SSPCSARSLLYPSPEDFKIPFKVACEITGKVLAYNRNRTKKNPMVPMKVPISTKVGWNKVHDEVNRSLLKSITIISKRSNHIPMLMIIETTNVQMILRLYFRIQSVNGTTMLQIIRAQKAHQYGPVAAPNERYT